MRMMEERRREIRNQMSMQPNRDRKRMDLHPRRGVRMKRHRKVLSDRL